MSNGGFWSNKTLKERLPGIIEPYDETAVVSCAYELSVGGEAFVTGENSEKLLLKEGESVSIPPGQVALIITKEKLKSPPDALGLLSFKSEKKVRGLINVSGFHVDPGFTGRLVFSMYNAGVQNIHLTAGTRLFMLWFCSTDGASADTYNGVHRDQTHIPDNYITNLAARMPSPFTLEKDVESLRYELRTEIDKVQRTGAILLTLTGSLLVAVFTRSCLQTPSAPSNAAQASMPTISAPGVPRIVLRSSAEPNATNALPVVIQIPPPVLSTPTSVLSAPAEAK